MTTEADRQAERLAGFVSAANSLQIYGMEWGDPDQHGPLRVLRDELLFGNLRPGMTALEIGAGGGRWSRYFMGRVERAILVDGTSASERAIRSHCDWPGFEFLVSTDGRLPSLLASSVDFAFSFDTFVHFEPQLFDHYLAELGRVLKPDARFVLHYATRWLECEPDDCFRYRDDLDVERVLYAAGFMLTGRDLPFRCGYGSIVREAVRANGAAEVDLDCH